jgi:hypothetical protein
VQLARLPKLRWEQLRAYDCNANVVAAVQAMREKRSQQALQAESE